MRYLVIGAVVAGITWAGPAAGQEPAADVGVLVTELEGQIEELQSAECDTACAALASLRRSADAICELDPGERCVTSREKVADAEARVRARCPDCAEGERDGVPAATTTPPPGPPPADSPPTPGGGLDDLDDEEEAKSAADQPANEPEAVQRSGGCAACTIGGEGRPSRWSAWALAGLFGLAMARRLGRRS